MEKDFFANLIDSCVEGQLTFDDLSIIKEHIDSKNAITGWYAKNAFHDLATLRYRFTMEVVVSTILYYLTRPRGTSRKALKNFKLAQQLLAFIIDETDDLIKREEQTGQAPKRRRKKPKNQKPEEEEQDGTNS